MTGKEYLEQHTINDESIEKFGLVAQDDKVLIPIKDQSGEVAFIKARNMEGKPKFRIPSGANTILFNSEILNNKPSYVVITGGEVDCIRLDQEGVNAVSSTAGEGAFKPEWIDQLASVKNIFICLDSDEAGKKAAKTLATKFNEDQTVKIIEFPPAVKDVCEYYQYHTYNDFVKLVANAKLAEPEAPLIDKASEYRIQTLAELLDKEYPEEQWIIEKILPQEGMVLFTGDAGVGKSFISLEIVKSLVLKNPFLDRFIVRKPDTPILVIDKENGARRIQKRVKGMGVPGTDQVFFLEFPEKFTLDNEEFVQTVKDFIKEHNIGVIILDSFIDILIGKENDSGDTATIFNALRSIASSVCWVILHHEVKPIAGQQPTAINRGRGSGNIKAQVDVIFSIVKSKQPRTINVEQAKARDYELLPMFAVEFVVDPQTSEVAGFKYVGIVEDAALKIQEAKDAIVELLRNSSTAMGIADFKANIPSIGEKNIRNACSELEADSVIRAYKGDHNAKFYELLPEEHTEEGEEPEPEFKTPKPALF